MTAFHQPEFDGRRVLVTGGARGIGFEAARQLAMAGAETVLVDLRGAEESAASLESLSGRRSRGFHCDIRDASSVAALRTAVEDGLGPIDTLVNSAALLDDKLFLDSAPSDWARIIDVCLYGPMHMMAVFLPGMCERGFGRIVCLASDSARIGQARLSYYAAAKGGVIALVKSVAQEVGSRGVTLNVVSPGATNTELRQQREETLRLQMGEEKYARRQKSVLKMYPAGRIGEPEDAGAAIRFLAGRDAGWITGQVLSVNGGFTMP